MAANMTEEMTASPVNAPKAKPAPWTPQEKVRLRFLWTQTIRTRANISEELGRTISACSAQSQTMMLKRFHPEAAAKVDSPRPKAHPKAAVKISVSLPENRPEAGRADAERQAKRIRVYWEALGQPKTVDVRYVQGCAGNTGSWSPVILDKIAFRAPVSRRFNP
jgi:hypothetical protein